jgi:hypothetical protein
VRKLDKLFYRRETLLAQQAEATHELMTLCIDPIKGAALINDLNQAAAQLRELQREVDAAIERTKKNWWERMLA